MAVLLLVPAGLVAGSSLKVSKGPIERGVGLYVGATNVGGWCRFSQVTGGVLPSGVTAASLSRSSPSLLPSAASSSWSLNGTTTGSAVEIWAFTMSATAPTSTELELSFNVSLAGSVTRLVAFVETPSTAPAGGELVRFYFVTGPIGISVVTVQSLTENSALCTSVGVCP